jgi:hypothetical protein
MTWMTLTNRALLAADVFRWGQLPDLRTLANNRCRFGLKKICSFMTRTGEKLAQSYRDQALLFTSDGVPSLTSSQPYKSLNCVLFSYKSTRDGIS